MNELTIIFILSFVIVVLLPLLGLLAKDVTTLIKRVKDASKDGIITKDEVDDIVKDVGAVLRSIVRLFEAVFIRKQI